ncbi:hypothetical protein V5O48_007861 [Marasmius crinis-equi]|uniref:F-box domain-containing protein n=1 Tax=Marasmius crinis-equi TaxID=585013 RepID=A0ABR3FFY8_9AGAR
MNSSSPSNPPDFGHDVHIKMDSTLSPFSHFLETNYVPASEEREEIYALVKDHEQRLRFLDEEIARLQAEREQLRRFVDPHRKLLSPFRRLPADIWREIFVRCLPTNKFNLPGRTMKDAPLLLTVVCRLWREIALQTPRLWNGIHVYLPRILPPSRSNPLPSLIRRRREGVKTWLDRSGTLPITFSICLQPLTAYAYSDAEAAEATIQKLEIDAALFGFMELLAQYSYRLKAVKFQDYNDMLAPEVLKPFVKLTSNDLPLLEDVDVSVDLLRYDNDADPPTTEPTPLANLLSTVSGLHTFHISQAPTDAIMAQWASLAHLKIGTQEPLSDPVFFIARIMDSCPLLSSLILFLMIDRPHAGGVIQRWPNHTPIQMAHLRSFDMRSYDVEMRLEYPHSAGELLSGRLSAMFQRVHAPALESLAIHPERSFSGISATDALSFTYLGSTMPFHDMILQSDCRITHLDLGYFLVANPDALFETLTLCPSLISLKLSVNVAGLGPYFLAQERQDIESHISRQLVTLLRSLSSPPIRCMLIEELYLEGCCTGAVDPILILANALPRLKCLSADFGGLTKMNDRIRAAVTELRKVRGMRVVWKWKEDVVDPLVDYANDQAYAGMMPSSDVELDDLLVGIAPNHYEHRFL